VIELVLQQKERLKMYKVEYAYKRGTPGASAVGTRVRKTLPFDDKIEADKHADWLKLMGSVKVRVVEEKSK
jgi:hypothetical protein